MIDLLKNIQGSPKSTLLGALLVVLGCIVGWFEKAGWGELFPFFVMGAYLFVKKDNSK